MKLKSLFKKIIIPALILIVLVGGYFVFVRSDVSITSVALPPNPEITQAEREILSLLSDLRNIDLSDSLFNSEAFESLVDYGVELSPEPIGRDNPFAPLGEVTVIEE